MKAYKCDICGGLYEKNAYLVVKIDQQNMKCGLKFMFDNPEFTPCAAGVDVCPDCLKALQNVINERKNQNVQ